MLLGQAPRGVETRPAEVGTRQGRRRPGAHRNGGRLADEQNNARAQFQLGIMYEKGRGVAQDDGESAKWYRLAAERGNAYAQNSLGFMYEKGRSLPQEDGEALKWYRLSAEQDNFHAIDSIGTFYVEGRGGLAQNDLEACQWYRLAAEQGNARAQYHFSVMLFLGRGVAQSDDEGQPWLYRAATAGDESAQYLLGMMYAEGLAGIAYDVVQAMAWLKMAAQQGHAAARLTYDRLKDALPEVDEDAVQKILIITDLGEQL